MSYCNVNAFLMILLQKCLTNNLFWKCIVNQRKKKEKRKKKWITNNPLYQQLKSRLTDKIKLFSVIMLMGQGSKYRKDNVDFYSLPSVKDN